MKNTWYKNWQQKMMVGVVGSLMAISAQAEQTTVELDYLTGGQNVKAASLPTCANPSEVAQELKIFGSIAIARTLTLYSSAAPVVNFTVSPTQANTTLRLAGIEFGAQMAVPGFSATLATNQTQQSTTIHNFSSSAPLKVITGSELQSLYANGASPRRRLTAQTNASGSTQADSANVMYVTLTNVSIDLVLELTCG